MANLTIRNVPDDVHKNLRMRAAQNGRSVEEEVRRILALTVGPVKDYKNPKTREEIAAAVKSAQEFFAPMAKTYSVDQFIAEKREEAARERAKLGLDINDPPATFRK